MGGPRESYRGLGEVKLEGQDGGGLRRRGGRGGRRRRRRKPF
jgi:hypothetical protein